MIVFCVYLTVFLWAVISLLYALVKRHEVVINACVVSIPFLFIGLSLAITSTDFIYSAYVWAGF